MIKKFERLNNGVATSLHNRLYPTSEKFFINEPLGVVVSRVTDIDGNAYIGKARCNYEAGDTFDISKGKALASARARKRYWKRMEEIALRHVNWWYSIMCECSDKEQQAYEKLQDNLL